MDGPAPAAGVPLLTKELARLAGYDLVPLADAEPGAFTPLSDHCHHHVLMGKATEAAIAMDEDGVRTAEELQTYTDALAAARDHLQRILDKARTELTVASVTPIRAA